MCIRDSKEAVQLAMRSERKERISVVARYVSDAEAALFFSAADVLIVPYTRASQSGVAHIGMAFGMPIIASDVGVCGRAFGNMQGQDSCSREAFLR